MLSAGLTLVVLALGPVAALAVEGDEGAADEGDTLAISNARVADYPEVRLTVDAPLTAVDTEVPAEAFALKENGVERAIGVERLQSEDLEVALIMDTSGSMEGAPLEAARQAASEFTSRMPAAVQISVIEFNTEATLISEFTTDRNETDAALAGLTSGGWTSMYDALHVAMDVFEDRQPDRRAIVLLSDGGDNRSQATLEETIARLEEGDKVLHIVELITAERPVPRERFGRDGPEVDQIDLDALRSLADAAGQGFVASPQDLDAVSEVYEDIASTLMNQYEITYDSQAHGTARVEVRLDHDGTTIGGERDIELPPAPTEDEPAEATPEEEASAVVVEEEPEDEATAVAADEAGGVSVPYMLDEPWVLWTSVAAGLIGLAFLVYYAVGIAQRRE